MATPAREYASVTEALDNLSVRAFRDLAKYLCRHLNRDLEEIELTTTDDLEDALGAWVAITKARLRKAPQNIRRLRTKPNPIKRRTVIIQETPCAEGVQDAVQPLVEKRQARGTHRTRLKEERA